MVNKRITLGILVTTMDKNIDRVKKELLPQLKNVDEIIISHQITDKSIKPQKNLSQGKIKYFYMFNKGLSKNRNNCLKYSKADICHICDDDISYVKNFEKRVKENFEKNKNISLLCIQSITKKNELRKDFFRKNKIEKVLDKFGILKISSIEIFFRRKEVTKNRIKFNENFGLGTKYPSGEENIFLKDCLDKKLKILYVPQKIVIHPQFGSFSYIRDSLIIGRVKSFKKMFGFFGGFGAVFYFSIFKYKDYKKKYSIFKYFWISLKGLFG